MPAHGARAGREPGTAQPPGPCPGRRSAHDCPLGSLPPPPPTPSPDTASTGSRRGAPTPHPLGVPRPVRWQRILLWLCAPLQKVPSMHPFIPFTHTHTHTPFSVSFPSPVEGPLCGALIPPTCACRARRVGQGGLAYSVLLPAGLPADGRRPSLRHTQSPPPPPLRRGGELGPCFSLGLDGRHTRCGRRRRASLPLLLPPPHPPASGHVVWGGHVGGRACTPACPAQSRREGAPAKPSRRVGYCSASVNVPLPPRSGPGSNGGRALPSQGKGPRVPRGELGGSLAGPPLGPPGPPPCHHRPWPQLPREPPCVVAAPACACCNRHHTV